MMEVARQLTLPTFKIYSQIKPSELFNQAWLSPKLQHKSPNVLKLIDRFNWVSNWVASSIVSESKIKNRAKVFAMHIKLAQV
jgi:glycine hydroxymethyltransferase/Rap guanine nucleotide exchange factor 1